MRLDIQKLSSIRTCLLACLVASTTILAACGGGAAGGGGGGGGGGNNPPPAQNPNPPAPNPNPPAPNPNPPAPPSFNTSEYRQNQGLPIINALEAYEDGLSGAGVTVAVIDNGVDPDQIDLAGNLSPASRDIIAGRNQLEPDDDHGTLVASVIAARKNGLGTHGVAFNSTLLAIRADSPDACDDDACGFFDRDLAVAVDYAVDNGADIINFSLSGDAPHSAAYKAALDRAATAGVILVFAGGNDGDATPDASTIYVNEASARGQAIVVGSVDLNEQISDFSDRAGTLVQSKFLVAPGDGVIASGLNDTLYIVSGTSFATPHVAGAAALLLQKFPNLSAADVVDILLRSAKDLGAAGSDAIYGRGLIDLAAAIEPIGPLGIVLSDDAAVTDQGIINPPEATISVGAAFGDALTSSPAARAAYGSVVATDSYDRAYTIDLGRHFQAIPDSRFNLANQAQNRIYGRHFSVAAPGLGVVEVGYTERWGMFDEAELFPNLNRDSDSQPLNVSFSLHRQVNDRTILSLQHGAGLTDDFVRNGVAGGAPLMVTENAFLKFAESGTGAQITHLLTDNTQLGFVATYADYQLTEDTPSLARSLTAVSLSHRVNERLGLSLQLGSIFERGSVLNMVADEAYNAFANATTIFTTLSAHYQLQDWSFSVSASYGNTTASDMSGSLFSDISTLHTTAFSAEARWRTNRPGHFLSFGVSQPLRVESGAVMVNVPTARDIDTGEFSFTSSALTLSPTGREIDFEVGHLFHTDRGFSIASNLVYRLNPGHSAYTKNAIALFSHARWSF